MRERKVKARPDVGSRRRFTLRESTARAPPSALRAPSPAAQGKDRRRSPPPRRGRTDDGLLRCAGGGQTTVSSAAQGKDRRRSPPLRRGRTDDGLLRCAGARTDDGLPRCAGEGQMTVSSAAQGKDRRRSPPLRRGRTDDGLLRCAGEGQARVRANIRLAILFPSPAQRGKVPGGRKGALRLLHEPCNSGVQTTKNLFEHLVVTSRHVIVPEPQHAKSLIREPRVAHVIVM